MYFRDLPISALDYPEAFKSRFLFSFVALAILALIYEHLRSKSQVGYQELSDRLDLASRTDELTGLSNRREIRELLDAKKVSTSGTTMHFASSWSTFSSKRTTVTATLWVIDCSSRSPTA
jgi:hypothetical protein